MMMVVVAQEVGALVELVGLETQVAQEELPF
jgi:type III secretory pathway component EscS